MLMLAVSVCMLHYSSWMFTLFPVCLLRVIVFDVTISHVLLFYRSVTMMKVVLLFLFGSLTALPVRYTALLSVIESFIQFNKKHRIQSRSPDQTQISEMIRQ